MDSAPTHRHFEITLLQERAAGTFARVYLAEAIGADGLSRIVAVKVLKEQWSDSGELLDRTRDEARLLARLHHKNILRVEAMAELQGQPTIIMEFVDGLDLKQLIEGREDNGDDGGKPIPARAAYSIAQRAASALEAAYFKVPYGMSDPLKVVHRDVKPSNIMVSCEGGVKVLDFGTARYSWEGRHAKTGALRFGSLKYMSPERRSGDRGDHSSDIYSLGLVLIEMLRGKLLPLLPLDEAEHDGTIAALVDELTNLCMPNEDWAASLRQTLGRMCASDPALRLNAEQCVQLLRAFADQANGPSLDSFAAEQVTSMSTRLYGGGSEGALSGSRIFVAINGATGEGQAASGSPSHLSPAASAPDGETFPPDPGASNVQSVPSGSGLDTDPFGYSLPGEHFERTPVEADPSQDYPTVRHQPVVMRPGASVTAPAMGMRPGSGKSLAAHAPPPEPDSASPRYPEASELQPAPIQSSAADRQLLEQHTVARHIPEPRRAPHPGPEPVGHGAAEGRASASSHHKDPEPTWKGAPSYPAPPVQGGAEHAAARPRPMVAFPPTEEPPPRSKLGLVVGVLLGFVLVTGLGLAMLGGGAAAWFMWPINESTSTGPQTDLEVPDPTDVTATGDINLSVEAADDTIQWVRVIDEAGTRVLSAKPTDSAELALGTYELQAKVVGLVKVSGSFELSEPLALSCVPAKANKVRCTGPEGLPELLLAP